MFNTKRIIFLIGLLSLVTLTGALLAGPAFASKPESAHKAYMCHYQALVLDDPLTLDVNEAEAEMWQAKQIDSKSVDKHIANHGFGDAEVEGDTLISDMGENAAQFDGYVFTTQAECLARDLSS